jgi:thioredoxin reductase (NADPH)
VRVKDVKSGAESDLEVSAIFACVGLVPNTALFRDLVKLDASGRAHVDAAMRTSAKGLFAAGNVRAGSPHRAAGAMGDGAAAATAADRYLTTGEWT